MVVCLINKASTLIKMATNSIKWRDLVCKHSITIFLCFSHSFLFPKKCFLFIWLYLAYFSESKDTIIILSSYGIRAFGMWNTTMSIISITSLCITAETFRMFRLYFPHLLSGIKHPEFRRYTFTNICLFNSPVWHIFLLFDAWWKQVNRLGLKVSCAEKAPISRR